MDRSLYHVTELGRKNFVGCDLSRDRLDIYHLAAGRREGTANEPGAVADWCATLQSGAHIVLETTSGCDGAVMVARGVPEFRSPGRPHANRGISPGPAAFWQRRIAWIGADA